MGDTLTTAHHERGHDLRQRRTSGPGRVTWADLTAREPRLLELLDEIDALPGDAADWCGVRAWFGGRRGVGGLRGRMVALVGWHAERDDALLRTDVAYRAAYRALYDALPPCRDCLCGAVGRVLYGVAALPGGGTPAPVKGAGR